MKTAISIPDPLFEAADQMAKRLGVSRSEFFQRAAQEFLREHREAGVTEALNAVYSGKNSGRLDPVLKQLQLASLPQDEWQ